jgi:hypothetical protein
MNERLASSCSTAEKEMLHVVSLSDNVAGSQKTREGYE